MADAEAPRLRPDIEAFPVVYQGREGLALRDTLGLIVRPVVVQGEGLILLRLLDGRRTLRDIQETIVRLRGGRLVTADQVRGWLDELDAAFILDGPRYRAARAKLAADYARRRVRSAALAGESYPARRELLQRELDGVLSAAPRPASGPDAPGSLAGLAAPHIDLKAGAPGYAAAYGLLAGAAPDLVVLFGTGHCLDAGYLALTDKDFRTPLGLVRTDREVVAALRRAAGTAAAPDDLAHRREHSLEFQLLFLQRRLGRSFALVPVLWGSFAKDLARVSRPAEIPGVADVLSVLRETIRGRKALVVAGVDLSHIGPKFGHDRGASALRAGAEAHDRRLLEAAGRGDVEAFWAESRRVRDAYNVCGFASLACLLEALAPVSGRVLAYEMTTEEATRSAVSYAALAFYRV
jgi:AmmeMemoRadiSam system protein B